MKNAHLRVPLGSAVAYRRPYREETHVRVLRTDRTAWVIIAGHAFMQNRRRGHCELAVEAPPTMRVAAAFAELAEAV
jgi:hypothetical protein